MKTKIAMKRYNAKKREKRWYRDHLRNTYKKRKICGKKDLLYKSLENLTYFDDDDRSSHSSFIREHRKKKMGYYFMVMLPVMNVIVSCTTILTCYTITIKKGGINSSSDVLFIDNMTRDFPQNCFFFLGMFVYSVLSMVLALLKYQQISVLYGGIANRLGIVTGVLAALSLILAANFQSKSDHGRWMYISFMASYMVFSLVYFTIHVYLTRYTPAISTRKLFIIRIFLLEFMSVSALTFVIFLSPDLSRRLANQVSRRLANQVSNIASWCFFAFQQVFTLTFTSNMRKMMLHFQVVVLPRHQAGTIAQFRKHRKQVEEKLLTVVDDDTRL